MLREILLFTTPFTMAGADEPRLLSPKKRRRKRNPNAERKPATAKYWRGRYWLFSRYDAGIRMDEEGWFSVTPEPIAAAAHAARAAPLAVVVDAFAGVGGNAIQFAAKGCYVVAVEIDPRKVKYARHNAKIYGVEDHIDFVIGDFFRLAPSLKGDIVFLSPQWGGPSYREIQSFTLDMLKPKDGYSIFQAAQKITPNVIMFLPRNMDINQVEELSWLSSPPLSFEIEENHVQNHVKGITAYFGDIASRSSGLSNEFSYILTRSFQS